MPSPTATATATSLLSLSLGSDYSLSLAVNAWLIGTAFFSVLVLLIVGVWRPHWWAANFDLDKAELGLGPGKLSFRPNSADQQIAYAIWVELSTRKIGLPIDLNHDVIWEVYESWHTFFSVTRELIKTIPVTKAKVRSTREIINLSVAVLNQGLRPHLTKWHARFRHWYEAELKKANGDIDPQVLQSKYPRFKELEKDLLNVNTNLIRYREKMGELVLGLEPLGPAASVETSASL